VSRLGAAISIAMAPVRNPTAIARVSNLPTSLEERSSDHGTHWDIVTRVVFLGESYPLP
jgi:hypothetical protein